MEMYQYTAKGDHFDLDITASFLKGPPLKVVSTSNESIQNEINLFEAKMLNANPRKAVIVFTTVDPST